MLLFGNVSSLHWFIQNERDKKRGKKQRGAFYKWLNQSCRRNGIHVSGMTVQNVININCCSVHRIMVDSGEDLMQILMIHYRYIKEKVRMWAVFLPSHWWEIKQLNFTDTIASLCKKTRLFKVCWCQIITEECSKSRLECNLERTFLNSPDNNKWSQY